MRGELFIGFASFLALASTILLIFAHVGQINLSSVPRRIYMTKVNVSQYGDALGVAFLDPINGLYTDNASAPLLVSAGLRQHYEFGLYSYCAYVNETAGICSNHTAGFQFTPFDTIKADMIANYSSFTNAIVPSVTFRDTHYLGQSTKAAYYLILLGTIAAALAFFSGVAKYTITFFLSSVLAVISSLFLLIGAALWTVVINRSGSVNKAIVGSDTNETLLGIEVSIGPGLYLVWAAFACMCVSTIPYFVISCTYRG